MKSESFAHNQKSEDESEKKTDKEDINPVNDSNSEQSIDYIRSQNADSPDTELNQNEASLPSSVSIVERDGKVFYIIGTAHISRKSVEDVNFVVDTVCPDTVCVELCRTRYETLTDESRWNRLDIFQIIKERKVLLLLSHLMLSSYQRQLGERFGVKPGSELIAGIEAAERNGAKLVLADRNVQTTLTRTWRNLGLWDKLKLLSILMAGMFTRQELSEEDIENLKEKDQLSEVLNAFAESFPRIKKPLIDERDDYLMSHIADSDGHKVVAVVGAGHVSGILENFGQEVDREKLDEIPPPGLIGKSLKWLIPAIVIGAFGVGIYRHEFSALDSMLKAWIFPNAAGALLGTLIAGAKPLTILVSTVASPLTSLNPTINTGIVAGVLEAWLRKPTVEDCRKIQDDIRSFRGIYRNQFTRVLLVSAMATFGSAIGAWIGATWLVSLVAS